MQRTHELFAQPRMELPRGGVGIAGLSNFGRYNYTRARAGLAPHAHPGAIEICYLVKGRQTYHVGGRDYRLRGGDVFVTFPGESHSTGGAPEEKGVLYWLILRLPRRAASGFLGLAPGAAQPLAGALRQLPARHFRGTPAMQSLLDEILVAGHQPRSPLRATRIANRLTTFLLLVAARADARATMPADRGLAPVLEHIAANLETPPTVPELARLAGLSVSRFQMRFRQETGVPPREYVQRARIDEARCRLQVAGARVTDVAFALGFASSQYFATVYRRFTGESPGRRR